MKIFDDIHYGWKNAEPACSHEYTVPSIIEQIQALYYGKSARILDIGCGNGYVASKLADLGHSVIAVDASLDGISIAQSAHPNVEFKLCSIYNDKFADVVGGLVDCIISLEVVEHLFYPRRLFEVGYDILRPCGYLIISTPYHGYWKNLAISFTNRWDRHFTVEWDGGHIKFFSKKTISEMACSVGFRNPRFLGVGRFIWFWKSMIMVVEK